MTSELVSQLLDACFYGKQITEWTPTLPTNMKPRHIHVIDAIDTLSRQRSVRISDVSRALRVTTPSVTKLINELVDLGTVEKRASEEDCRVTILTLTPLGEKYAEHYIRQYHSQLAKLLETLDEKDCQITIQTLKTMAHIMREHPIQIKL